MNTYFESQLYKHLFTPVSSLQSLRIVFTYFRLEASQASLLALHSTPFISSPLPPRI